MSLNEQQSRLLNLIAPRPEHKGLVANNPWLPEACRRAADIFGDKGLQAPAVVLAAVHEAAIDYLVRRLFWWSRSHREPISH